MASLFDFSQAISKLNKEKKFAETLKYFKENKTQFTTEQIASNDYLISAMLTALRQTGNFDSVSRPEKSLHFLINNPVSNLHI